MQIDLSIQQQLQQVAIDTGVHGFRPLKNLLSYEFGLTLANNELVWICSEEDELVVNNHSTNERISVLGSEAILLTYPKSSWDISIHCKKGTFHFFVISLRSLHEYLSADFNEDNLEREDIDYSKASKVVHLKPHVSSHLMSIFQSSNDSYFQRMEGKGKFILAFSNFLEQLFGNTNAQCPFKMSSDIEEKIRTAHQLIIKDLSHSPDPTQLSYEVNVSKTKLQEGFKFLYGMSIYEYYNDYRIERAAQLLQGGDFLVKEIAYDIGYQNPSHFIAAFKKRKGCTPKKYMQQF